MIFGLVDKLINESREVFAFIFSSFIFSLFLSGSGRSVSTIIVTKAVGVVVARSFVTEINIFGRVPHMSTVIIAKAVGVVVAMSTVIVAKAVELVVAMSTVIVTKAVGVVVRIGFFSSIKRTVGEIGEDFVLCD